MKRNWAVYIKGYPNHPERRFWTLFFAESYRQKCNRAMSSAGFRPDYFLINLKETSNV